tara:strand:+ start:46552 stop:49668 length:3117 start_codon:yes stop_codon:yes gene_type:complete
VNTAIKEDLNDLVMIAATLCNCTVGLITFENEEYQHLKFNFGLSKSNRILRNSVDVSLLKNTDDITIIYDLKQHVFSSESSFNASESPYVFYVGCPLIAQNGAYIGSLSIWDTKPNKLSGSQKKSLQVIIKQIIKLLDLKNKPKSNDLDVKNRDADQFFKNRVRDKHIGAWELDIHTSNFKVDQLFAELLGYKLADLQQLNLKSCVHIFHPDDFPNFRKLVKDIYNKKIHKFAQEFRVKHKNERWVWASIKAQVVKSDNEDNPLVISGSLIDINEQKIKEFQLNAILDNVTCAAFRHIIYPDGSQQTVNISKGAFKLWGLTDEEIFEDHDNIWKLIHEDDIDYLGATVQESASTLKEWKAEWRINHPDGSIKWHRGQGIPLKNKDGSVSWDSVVIDITADKNKEENLKEINIKLNQAQKIAKLGYWQWDLATRTGLWTDQVYKIYGIEKTDVQPKAEDILDTVFPEDLDIINEKRKNALEFDQEFAIEGRIRLRDGTIKWVRQIGHYTKDSTGVPISYEGTIQDITESKLVSLALEESIQRYTYVTKATSDAIWDLDFLKGKLYWGENYKKLFGHPSLDSAEDDLAYWESKIHPDDRERVIENFNACIKNGVVKWEEEYRFINVNNEYSNVVDRAFVIRNDKGEAVRMVGAIQDVTEKLQAFEEIKRSNERFEKVADATNDAIWDWDLVHNVLYQGPGYFKLFGHKPIDSNGDLSSWQKFVHPDDLSLVMGNAQKIQQSKTETYFNTEYRYLKSDGTYANVIDRSRVIRNKDGEAIRMVGAMQDVTESKMYEESLRLLNHDLEKQARELYHYNEELEQFAYVVSHDLQEPLRMISSFLMLLEKKYNDVLDDEGKKYIYFAVDGAKRMRQIILDLLDFSRVGRTDEELETIDLNELVADVQLIFRQEIENKNAKIQTNPLPVIQNYKILLDQLFQNLIGNALKYQKEGEIPIIDISHEDLGTHHQFIVSDNGIGIDSEYFDKIFVIFQRLHGRNQYNGTGIGLALVKKIVDNLQGKIWVESDLNVGSKFIFTIKKNSNY